MSEAAVVPATIAIKNILLQDDVVLTATNTLATLPVDNLQTTDVSEVMRCNDVDTTIQITLDAAVPFRQLGLFGIGEDIETLRVVVRASTTALGNTDVLNYDSAASPVVTGSTFQFEPRLRKALLDLGSNLSARYFEIELYTTGDNVEVGAMFLARALEQTETDITFPFGLRTIPGTQQKRMMGGQLRSYRYPSYQSITLNWGTGISQEDLFDTLGITMDIDVGLDEPVMVCLQPGHDQYGVKTCIMGWQVDLGENAITGYEQFAKTIRIEEAK